MPKSSSLNGSALIIPAMFLAAILLSVSIVPGALASSNSGPGRGGDDDRDDRIILPAQDPSAVTNTIIIPQDAESHSAANPYSPKVATVSSGSTVTWINADDEDQHTATADDGSFSTGMLSPGQSGQAIINAPAGSTISYHCDVHPEMRGVLQVSGAANGGNAAGMQTGSSLNSTSLGISDQPLAVGRYTTTSENPVNNTISISVAGNTTINLPNSTETITTNDTGKVTLTMTGSGGGILEGQVRLTTTDGSENATVTVTEFFSSENAPGRGIASFSTDSTGKLAPLDGLVAIVLDEGQPDGSVRVSFFEWPLVNNLTGPAQSNSGNVTGGNQTAITTPPATTPVEGGTIEVSVTPGSSSKTTNAYDPNPVQAAVGDTVRWTNDDSTPHTATSGQPGQADGIFGGEPGSFGSIIAPGQTQEFTFTEAGEFPYYCGLHPNMAGSVSVG